MSWLLALTSPQALSQLGASLTARFNAELAAAEDQPDHPRRDGLRPCSKLSNRWSARMVAV